MAMQPFSGFTQVPSISGLNLDTLVGSVEDQTALTAPAADDTVLVGDTSAAANKKLTLENFFKVIDLITAETDPAVGDEVVIYDASGSAGKKMTLANLFKAVGVMTAKSAAVGADQLVIADSAASGAAKTITVNELLNSFITGLAALTYAETDVADLFLVYDASASAFKTITQAQLAAGINV